MPLQNKARRPNWLALAAAMNARLSGASWFSMQHSICLTRRLESLEGAQIFVPSRVDLSRLFLSFPKFLQFSLARAKIWRAGAISGVVGAYRLWRETRFIAAL